MRYAISCGEEILESRVDLYDEKEDIIVKDMKVSDLIKLLNLQDLMIDELKEQLDSLKEKL
jgi:hypothetical protein